MSVTINNNSGLIGSPESGCGCGNRKYYTKAEIDEMFKDILDPEQIMAIVEQIVGEYVESEEFREIVISVIGEDYYTKAQIDILLEDYATKSWAGEQGYLKDITLTINGTQLHNNGSIDIGGGGDISGKLDITAFTQAMENETARTEDTYAKKSEIPSLQGYATQEWVGDQGYLKDITLTINGTELHNNGDIIIPGGGGEPVDISGKLDTTAFTQAMQSETARTENVYAKKTDLAGKVDTTAFTEFRNEIEGCCDNVYDKIVELFGLIDDLQNQIDNITGDTPTPPTPPTPDTGSTSYVLTTKYNVTSTSSKTKLLYKTNGLNSIILDNGTTISPTTGYTFESTGIKTIQYVLNKNYLPAQLFSGCTSLVEIVIPEGIKENTQEGGTIYEGHSFVKGCTNLTGATIPSTMLAVNVSFFKGCTKLNTIYSYAATAPSIPTSIATQNPFSGVSNTGTLYYPQGSNYSVWLNKLPSGWTGSPTL